VDDILDLFGDDPTAARAQASALVDAMKRRRAAGTLATVLGGPFAAAGKQFSGDAESMQQGLMGAGQQRAALGVQRQRLGQDAAQQQAEAAHRAAQLGLSREELGLKRQAIDQDAWGYGQDATGGGILYNKKTGQSVPLSPRGSFPGAGSGLKPQQFESDVQALGKDMEPIAKVQADLATLKGATEKGDVAGFGPVAGRVPGMLTSQEAVANRQAAARIMAGIIQMTSGQAASEKEVERLLEANGMGRTATDTQLKEGVGKLDAQYQNLVKQREAKYHPTVVQTYGDRGGFTGKAEASAEDQQAKAWADANPTDPRAAKILERLKAKGL
jgi:hypothetical protein